MRILIQLRQTLIGTGVVGAFFGVLVALGSFAFYFEYGPRIAGAPHDVWANTFHAIGTFFWVTVGIVVAFGFLPSAISFALSRLFRKASNLSSKRTREKPRRLTQALYFSGFKLVLYKYFSFNENSLSCLINNEVWASKPSEFNDPFDSSITIDFKDSRLQSLFEKWSIKKAVCCFSRNYQNILMWSHYADHHKGFCIGINWPDLEKSEILSSVNYSESFFESDLEAFLHSHVNGKINKQWEKILTQKYIDWKYEDEVRLILELNDSNEKGKLFPLKDGVITEIYFGCRMSNKNKETIAGILRGKNVKFHHLGKSTNDFSLQKIQKHNEQL